MRILTVSDKMEPVLYGPYIRDRVGKIDLILGCGDLPYYYLEYIVDALDAPLFMVRGNHDKVVPPPGRLDAPTSPAANALGWAVDLHGRSVFYKGLLIAGLEGSPLYNPEAPFQYSQSDMGRQAFRLGWQLRLNRLRYGRYLDVLITHAPPRGIHDAGDVAHRGFASYLSLLQRFRPVLMVHGHQHVYNRNLLDDTEYGSTRIVNTYGYRLIELAPGGNGSGWDILSISR